MAQIGYVIQAIFEVGRTYESYVEDYDGVMGQSGRLVAKEEFDALRALAVAAGAGWQGGFMLPSWSPRFHLARARRAFAEMRAAHDRLFNTLDAYSALANSRDIAQAQMDFVGDEAIGKRVESQLAVIEEVRKVRGTQWTNVGNALQAAEEVSNKYIRQPFHGPAQDRANQTYYDAQAEMIRYNDLLNQKLALQIGDLYDRMTVNALHADEARERLEQYTAAVTVQHLRDREELLGFDFTARIVDAITDVFQNAADVMRVVISLWAMDELERLSPGYGAGWYFPAARKLWPVWAGRSVETTAEALLGDYQIPYLDQADKILSDIERALQEFDANAARAMLQVKLAFAPGKDGVSRATLAVPSAFRFQEVNAFYLKGMPADVATVEAQAKDVRVRLENRADGFLHCTAELKDPARAMVFGSDGGLSGEAPIFALERDCLACATAGNQPIELACRSATATFTADCILRVVGFNPPTG